MTNKKTGRSFKRVMVSLIAVVMILGAFGVIANAATDGAVTEAISDVAEKAVETAETFSKKIHVLVNGEEIEADVKIEEHTGEDGSTYYTGEFNVTNPNGGEDTYFDFEFEDSEGDIGFGAGDIDVIINDSIEAHIPTTVAAE